jgi:hypothetical protein
MTGPDAGQSASPQAFASGWSASTTGSRSSSPASSTPNTRMPTSVVGNAARNAAPVQQIEPKFVASIRSSIQVVPSRSPPGNEPVDRRKAVVRGPRHVLVHDQRVHRPGERGRHEPTRVHLDLHAALGAVPALGVRFRLSTAGGRRIARVAAGIVPPSVARGVVPRIAGPGVVADRVIVAEGDVVADRTRPRTARRTATGGQSILRSRPSRHCLTFDQGYHLPRGPATRRRGSRPCATERSHRDRTRRGGEVVLSRRHGGGPRARSR